MKLEKPIKHLLVDLDGTLLGNHAFPLSLDFVSQALKQLKPLGGFRKRLRTLLEIRREFDRPSKQQTNDVRVIELFARRMNVGMEEARHHLREGVSLIFPKLERHFYPMPGAKEFLDWAVKRYQLTLATNPVWPEEIAALRLKWAGIDPALFSRVTDIRSMHACKPAPEYYEEVLAMLGARPDECLLIGNEVKMDLPATVVGIPVFIVGKFNEVRPVKLKGAKAPAWRGTFAHLRTALVSAKA